MNYKAKIMSLMQNIKKIIKNNREQLLGYALLFFSFLISLIHYKNLVFGDEEDNLLMGNLILKGLLPYRDVFSHHFPFAYFWTSLVYLISNDSIALARLSVIIFQILVFIISMRLSSAYLIFGIVSLIWSILKIYYWGNMLLYHSLAAPLSASLFILTYFLLISFYLPCWKHALVLAVFSALLILLTPLTIYGVFFVYLFLFIKERRLFLKSGLILVVIFCLFFLYLILTRSLNSFINQAILFNVNVYSNITYFITNKWKEDC